MINPAGVLAINDTSDLGEDYEDGLIHAGRNFAVKHECSDCAATFMGQVRQEGDPGFFIDGTDNFSWPEGANGVITLSGSSCASGTCADVSAGAYDATAADVTITDKLLIGYPEPFDEINLVVSTLQSGAILTW